MKTTVEIADATLEEARGIASREGITLRDLVEEGLRRAIQQRKTKRFRLRRATYRGKGVQPGVTEGDWEKMVEWVYEGRGG